MTDRGNNPIDTLITDLEAVVKKYKAGKLPARTVWFPICEMYENASGVQFYDVDPNALPKTVGKNIPIPVMVWVHARIHPGSEPGVTIIETRAP